MIQLKFYPYDLKFSEVFAVASSARTYTELIIVELTLQGKTGYGQASYPPYLGAKREADLLFLSRLQMADFESETVLNDLLKYMDSLSPASLPAKAAIDMAFYDLMGKIKGLAVKKMLNLEPGGKVFTSFTIGIGDEEFINRQLKKSETFETLKIKLDGDMSYNKRVIGLIRQHTDKAIGVDFNQGLKDKETAHYMLNWLSDKNVSYVEQPMPVELEKDYVWLKANNSMEIFGDESIQDASDILNKRDMFHGVNIKLMKCGGISKALEMVVTAKSLGLKLMIGCMAESVCAITAAANIASLFDRVDLDGHLMNANDIFSGIVIRDGEVILPDDPGLGVKKIF